MLEELTFRLTLEDGTVVDETVSLDFSDLSPSDLVVVAKEADLADDLDITAHMLKLRLSTDVPAETLKLFLQDLMEGKGVTLG